MLALQARRNAKVSPIKGSPKVPGGKGALFFPTKLFDNKYHPQKIVKITSTIPILDANETQNMLSMSQFGWTQEPISTFFLTRVLAYHKGRNQDMIPIATLFNNNETQNMLLISQFGWTQEPISTCVIKVLAYHNGKKST